MPCWWLVTRQVVTQGEGGGSRTAAAGRWTGPAEWGGNTACMPHQYHGAPPPHTSKARPPRPRPPRPTVSMASYVYAQDTTRMPCVHARAWAPPARPAAAYLVDRLQCLPPLLEQRDGEGGRRGLKAGREAAGAAAGGWGAAAGGGRVWVGVVEPGGGGEGGMAGGGRRGRLKVCICAVMQSLCRATPGARAYGFLAMPHRPATGAAVIVRPPI